MSGTTIGGAVKALLLAANLPGVGVDIYRDLAPSSANFPYFTFSDQFPEVPGLRGDGGAALTFKTMLQLDLWEEAVDEDFTLFPTVRDLLNGAVLTGTQDDVFTLKIADARRMGMDTEHAEVHHVFTLYADYSPS
jgi:hypothetical protein